MLRLIADVLDHIVRIIAPCLPGLHGGGVARWPGQSIWRVELLRHPRCWIVRVAGLQIVLDREPPEERELRRFSPSISPGPRTGF